MREDEASWEEIGVALAEVLQRWGIEPPARRGPHARVGSWIAPTSGSTKKPNRMQTMIKAGDIFSFPLFGSEVIAE